MAARRPSVLVGLTAAIALVCLGPCPRGAAQPASPVTVDDSPWAWELLQRAAEQATTNPAESVRLLERVLEEYPSKLVPWRPDGGAAALDRLRSARDAANELLRSRPALLDRYREAARRRARERLEAGDLEGVWRSALLTPAGCEATLRLAQADLESGRFAAALRRLESLHGHPDLEALPAAVDAGADVAHAPVGDGRDLSAHAVIIAGLAAAAMNERDRAGEALAALRAAGGEAASAGAAAIERLLDQGGVPPSPRGISSLDRSTGLPQGGGPWHLLESQRLPEAPFVRAFVPDEFGRSSARSQERVRERGTLATVVPTVVGSTAYVNEGTVVTAFDRLSGRRRWVRPLPSSPGSGAVEGLAESAGDVSAVTVEGDVLVTLVGHAGDSGRTGGGRVVCLDAETGRERWNVSLSRLEGGDELEGFYPHGAPLIEEGAVCLLARKVNNRLETVTYLVALDLADGRVRWTRHLSSCSGIRLGGARPYSTLASDRGLLYAATATGAIACVEACTGEIRWLRREPVPLRDPRLETAPWELSAPLVCSVGVLALAPDQMRVLLLSPDDGATLLERPLGRTETWGQPRYFLRLPAAPASAQEGGGAADGTDELVFAVGGDIVAFSVGDLGRPLWRLTEVLAGRRELIDDDRSGIRGRVQVVDDSLVVPLRDGVAAIDAADGELRTLVSGTGPGNPVVVGPQLLLAMQDRVDAFMPFEAAERFLRERMAQAPLDADRALALLTLASRAGSFDLALEAGEAALAAVNADANQAHAGQARADLIERLLEFDGLHASPDDAAGEALHALVGAAAVRPEQRVRHLLAFADWLARRRRLAEAVETWQRIFGDERMAATLVEDGDALRSAGLAATARVAELRRAEGDAVYAAQGAFAAAELERIMAAGGDPQELAALAARFPLAEAAVDAAERAVSRCLAEGEADAAVSTALAAWRRAELGACDRRGRLRLAGLVALAWQQAEAPARAAAFLDAYMAEHGDEIVIEGRPSSATEWRSQLIGYGAAPPRRLPRVGELSGEARELRGRLLPTPFGPPDRFLIASDGRLRLVGADLETRWELAIDDPNPRVLLFDEQGGRGLVLWSETVGEPVAISIDPEEGRIRWMTPRLSEHLPPVAARAPEMLLASGEAFDAAQVLPMAAGNTLVLARRSGDVVAFDLRNGVVPLWKARDVLRQVHAAAADDALLVLGGVDHEGKPAAVVLDARSGELRARRQLHAAAEVHWVQAAPCGLVLAGTDLAVEAFDPWAAPGRAEGGTFAGGPGGAPGGALAWRTTSPTAAGSLRAWSAGAWTALADAEGGLAAVRTVDGAVAGHRTAEVRGRDGEARFAAPQRGDGGGHRLRDVLVDLGGIVAHFEQRIVEFDRQGRPIGMDASADDRDYRLLLPAASRLLVVSSLGSEQIETAGGRRVQFSYRVYQLDRSQGCKLVGSVLQMASLGQRFETAQAVDGWLLLSTASAVTAVPLAPDA